VLATPVPDVVTSTTELINLNTASSAELESLPGIGPTTAQKIIDFREQNGPFLNAEDIINVSGIGPGTYERIKDLITVGP
jgi:competence protein ComEA